MTLLRSVPVGGTEEVEIPLVPVTVVVLVVRKQIVVKISGNNVQVNFRNQVNFGLFLRIFFVAWYPLLNLPITPVPHATPDVECRSSPPSNLGINLDIRARGHLILRASLNT